MDNQAKSRSKSRKPSARPELEPISYEEIMANAGMSGFVSFLDAPAAPPRPEPVPDAVEASVSNTVPVKDTVQESPTVQKNPTVQQRKSVEEASTVQGPKVQQGTPPSMTNTVKESYTVSPLARAPRKWRVMRTRGVEDGHSLAEQELYRTLWKEAAPESADPDASRTIRIGYDRLAALVRLSWVTVKANLRSLEKKLAIEVLAAEDSANREGKQYRVYAPAAVLARRHSAGLLWVRRTRGVELLTEGSAAEQRS